MNELEAYLKELQSMAMKIYAQSHGYHWNIEGRPYSHSNDFFVKCFYSSTEHGLQSFI